MHCKLIQSKFLIFYETKFSKLGYKCRNCLKFEPFWSVIHSSLYQHLGDSTFYCAGCSCVRIYETDQLAHHKSSAGTVNHTADMLVLTSVCEFMLWSSRSIAQLSVTKLWHVLYIIDLDEKVGVRKKTDFYNRDHVFQHDVVEASYADARCRHLPHSQKVAG